MDYYFVVPAVVEYVKDEEGNPTTEISSVSPSITGGKWIGDCKDGQNYIIKTDIILSGTNCQQILEEDFDSVVESLGFVPSIVRNWKRL